MLNASSGADKTKSLDFTGNCCFKNRRKATDLVAAFMECSEGVLKMVCAVCNGKGYVIEKGRELACSECQGRGEYPLYESVKFSSFDSRESRDASCSAPLGR